MRYRKVAYVVVIFLLTGVWGISNIDTSKIEVIQSATIQDSDENKEIEDLGSQVNLTMAGQSNIININTASKAELDKLYKVGPKIADKIIDYRNKNGKFKKKEDIMNVTGIGEKIFAKIKDGISVE